MNNLSNNLIFLIKRFDTTQSELALYVNVSQNSISNWINEISSPNLPALIRIHQYFGISIDALVFSDLKNGKIVTDDHVKEFKRIGKVNREVSGKVRATSDGYFVDHEGLQSMVNDPDQVGQWAMMGQFKQLHEKLDQLRVMGEELLKKKAK